MKLYGLTGGIGMGKSAAAQLLHDRGVSVIDTDVLARQVVENGQPALEDIRRVFGNGVLSKSGELLRGELAKIVFADPLARAKLEAIMHPRIRELWKCQVESWRAEQRPIAVVVIPLLFETRAESEFDGTICVACSGETQMRRLRGRGWTPDQIAQRIAAQWPTEKKIAKADYMVWNEAGLEVLSAQLNRLMSL